MFSFRVRKSEKKKEENKRDVESIVNRDGETALRRASGGVQGVCSTEYNTRRNILDCCYYALRVVWFKHRLPVSRILLS